MIRCRSVLVFACDHKLQLDPPKNPPLDPVLHANQQQRFADEVRQIIITENISVVGEEIGDKQTSILEAVVASTGNRYLKIDMPLELRQQKGCAGGYAHEVAKYDFDSEADWRANIDRCNTLREEYMFKMVAEATQPNDRVLVVCGLDHQAPLIHRFEEIAESVRGGSVNGCAWFDRAYHGWDLSE